MIISMTGFAAAAAELPGASLAVELRSVNHRFLDVSLRLPDEVRTIEPTVRETLAGSLRRGKVDCRVSLNRTQANASGLAVDEAAVGKLAVLAGVREFPTRVKCASLAWHTLKSAITNPSEVAKTE